MEFYELIIVWLLIFTRLAMLMYFIPVFSGRNVPRLVKVVLVLSLSLLFLTSGNFKYGITDITDSKLLIAILFEMLNGMTIGFAITIIMNSIYLAGHIIDMNIGFGMVNVMSANSEAQIPVTANFYYMMMGIVFFMVDAHHSLIDAFLLSLNRQPLGTLGVNVTHMVGFTKLISNTFVIGFKIAMPIILTVLISNILLGLLSKAMPGMNVFMVGMPFKILIGMITLALVLPVVYNMFFDILKDLIEFVYGVVARFVYE